MSITNTRWMRRALAVASSITAVTCLATNPAQVAGFWPTVLESEVTHMCADVPESGPGRLNDPVNQWYCVTSEVDNQMFWRWDYGNNRYWIVHSKTGLCLDVAPGGANARLTLWHCSLADDHIWIVRG